MSESFRYFNGAPSSNIEKWLGKRFNSWLPSRNALELRNPHTVVPADSFIKKDDHGTLSVTAGSWS